jgi:phage terminase small subunit
MEKKKLNAKQRAFVREYQKDFNATRAARTVGYSPKTADVQGYQLLQNPLVMEAIQKAEETALKEAGATTIKVLTGLANLANSDIRKLYREDGTLKDPSEWDDDIAMAVAGVETIEQFYGQGKERELVGYIKKVRLWDKNRALENLAKHFKLLTEKVEFPDKEGNPQSIGLLGDLDRATRLMFLVETIKKRAEISGGEVPEKRI